jgi:hypothetical protein
MKRSSHRTATVAHHAALGQLGTAHRLRRDENGAIKISPDRTWRCDPGDVGTIEGYDEFTPASWDPSGRYTSINGEVIPALAAAQAAD